MKKYSRLIIPSAALIAAHTSLFSQVSLYWDTTGSDIWTAADPTNWSETPGGPQTTNDNSGVGGGPSFDNFRDKAIFWEDTTATVALGNTVVPQELIVEAGQYTIDLNGQQMWAGFFGFQVDAGASLDMIDTNGAGVFNLPVGDTVWPNAMTVNGTMHIGANIIGVADSRLIMDGTGTLTVSGTNTADGARVESGTLIAMRAASLGGYNSAGKVVFNGGTIGVQLGGVGWTEPQITTLLINATKTSGALGLDTSNGDFTGTTVYTDTNLGGLALKKLGENTYTANTASTYTSATILEGGIFRADIADIASTSGAFGNGGDITFAGGTLQLTANSANSDYSARIKNSTSAIVVDTNGQDVTWSGIIDDTNVAGITKEGAGLLDIATMVDVNTSPTAPYSGATIVNGGTLRFTNTEDLGQIVSSNIQINNGSTLEFFSDVGGSNRTVINNKVFTFDSSGGGSINFDKGNHLFQGSATHNFVTTGGVQNQITSSSGGFMNGQNVGVLQFDVADGADDVDLLFSAAVSNAGFSKQGTGKMAVTSNIGGGQGVVVEAGTLSLSGVNSYTGATTVTGGTLLINGNQSTATGAVTVESGGTLGGSGTIGGETTINAGGFLSAGNSTGTMNFTEDVTVEGTIVLELVSTSDFDIYNGDGANVLTITGSTLIVDIGAYTFNEGDEFGFLTNWSSILGDFATITTINGSGQFSYADGILTAVPEPGSYALIAGLLGLTSVMVRRRK